MSRPRLVLAVGLCTDPDPQVRLAALLAIGRLPRSEKVGERRRGRSRRRQARQRPLAGRRGDSAAAAHDLGVPQGERCVDSGTVRHRPRRRRQSLDTHRRAGLPSTTPAAGPGRLDRSALAGRASAGADDPTGLAERRCIRRHRRGWPKDKPPQARSERRDKALIALCPGSPPRPAASSRRWATAGARRRSRSIRPRSPRACSRRPRTNRKPDAARVDAARQLVEFRPATPTTARDAPGPDHAAHVARAGHRHSSTRSARSEAPEAGAAIDRVGCLAHAGRPVARDQGPARPGRVDRRPSSTASTTGSVRLDELSLDQKQALAAHPDSSHRREGQGRSSPEAAACPTPTGRK